MLIFKLNLYTIVKIDLSIRFAPIGHTCLFVLLRPKAYTKDDIKKKNLQIVFAHTLVTCQVE